jgi:hypothetical protein
MKVTIQKPLNKYGWKWPAGKTVDVSSTFAAKLKKGGYLDAPEPKESKKKTTPKIQE